MNSLFSQSLNVINEGLASFADNIRQAGGEVIPLNWQPPAEGDRFTGLALAGLINHPVVEHANQVAMGRYLDAQPVLVDVLTAAEAIPAMAEQKLILHAGPPITWEEMCGPVKGAIIGAILFEGWAASKDAALRLVLNGEIALAPCHHYDAVGPMAGVISPSMPLWVIENKTNGKRAFSNFNEGLGKVLRFGANNEEVLERLTWISQELGPVMKAAVCQLGELELKPIMAQALHMGDEVHNRNAAATGLLIKRLFPALLICNLPNVQLQKVVSFISGNDHFFLNLSMAASKSMMDAAANVPFSSLVTVMARNGVNFGIRISGLGDQWFQAPANPVEGLFFPGYSVEDAAADLGDSAITETAGVGGFAMASSPAIVKFVGGTPADATENSRRMQFITVGSNPAFTLPALNFSPTAAGIDARKVVDRSILPIINTGIAHKEAGVGQIGAGITTAPMACFSAAIRALAQKLTEENPE
ncbi:DUF1116 domain-containing protein [Enterobacter cloacae complex sp.6722787]|uniref:DUF1116 domain-containing protein n=1 Tax=Aeromonas allosaccharophila TaxID=656 RepID=A0AAX3NY32_9GAMM|nr:MULTISPECIES: DUF1116 domain-containing protein [Gammaproteobacteria]EAP5418364.1 DUF1116 domain-containing protein [Salmonella enterica]EBW5300622.1 hypothetical protein [Salmonella enterica subsp. enterica serovar Bere]EDQ1201968.1 DUF1116 domain-containing protein [Salmonella enterica subsp. enterica serovar Ohio]EEE4881623.1 DUF1116 domain-containing protein [Salmonella enterica subsp. enterica serovar Enteritidis]EFN7995907.1 DUF1116 domain-containing protein [Escherichia coli]EHW7684